MRSKKGSLCDVIYEHPLNKIIIFLQVVDASIAKEMFSENQFKAIQIPSIAEKSKTGE